MDPARNQTQQIVEKLQEYHIEGAVIKIIYHIPAGKTDLVDVTEIQRACASAMYLSGIIPVRKAVIREKRADLTVNMDLTTLLENYFATKQELSEKKGRLIEKTLLLLEEQNHEEEESLS